MPHIIVEYSDNLSPDLAVMPLLKEMHHAIDGHHNVTLDRIKTRAYPATSYVVRDLSDDGAFVHIELKLLPGRNDDQKTDLSGRLLSVAQKHLNTTKRNTSITVEVSELHAPSYRA